ncbi:MAG: helix-hairpin-helix domain-containing protein [Oscillospiraceae bacterium]|nr:helix-hairpin-helix domain-containing protein [Oscillospiraceae bacterium]
MKKEKLPYIIVISLFFAACTLLTALTLQREPPYLNIFSLEPREAQATADSQHETAVKININTADFHELQTLPGIGEGRASGIIKYRTEVGDFRTIEEIMEVPTIGEVTFENIRDYIVVSTEQISTE